MSTSKRFSLNKADAKNILKVLGYSSASASVGIALSLIATADLSTSDATIVLLIPIINTVLVTVKKFLDEKTNA